MAIEINNFIMYLNNGNYEHDFEMFLNYLADDKNNTTIIRDRDKTIVNEEIFIIFNESLKNKHFNFSGIVFNKTVTFQTNRENGLEFNFENTYFEKLNILNCDVDNIIFSGEINYIKESNISECKIKGVTINSNIEGDVKFQKCIFEDFNKYNSGKNIKFGANFVFDFCETEDITNLMNFDFENRVSFKMSKFKNNIYFNNSYFKDYVDFHECEFEKIACFYGVKFDKAPNFSQVVLKGNLNALNITSNFVFDDLEKQIDQEHEDFNKDKKERDKKSLDKFANDFRDSFRTFKNALIKDNNLLDASKFHKYELYCKELELKNKKATTFKDIVDRYQLVFYRKLCDHHTDLLKAFHNLLIVIMLFGIFSFALDKFKQPSHIENDIKYNIVKVNSNENYIFKERNKTTYNLLSLNIEQDIQDLNTLLSEAKFHFVFGFSLLVIFIALLNKKYLWLLFLPLFWGTIYCIGFPISMISHFLIMLLFVCIFVFIMIFDSKAERFLFVAISYTVCIFTLLVKPSLLLPALGSFLDKD
ncbi:TPA: hypothetical protein RZK37_000623 [Campylobacter coli]|nr:hypothetical protein [Campylobacter coli]